MIANRLSRMLFFGLPVAFAACGGDSLTLPSEGEPAAIALLLGNEQRGRVGETLDQPLVVKVTDTRNRPVANAAVVFEFTEDGGNATPANTTTDAEGLASAQLRLGTREGQVTGMARVPVDQGTTPIQTPFTATALPNSANGIALVSGDSQVGAINTALPDPLVVKVTDAFGNPITGVPISWSVTGGGSLSETSTQTGVDGQTSVLRTLGGSAGTQTTLASADGLAGSPVTFTHTVTAGSASRVVKVSGDGQSALAGSTLGQPIVVQVLDAENNPIPNRAVSWVVGAGGGTVSPTTGTTDGQGLANAEWTLGPSAGANTLNAVVSGVGIASFTATATAGNPSASNSTVSASPENIPAGGTSTITVRVRDEGSNPVAGASVTLASSISGDNISPASASTNENGVATFSFSATVSGDRTITATAGGVEIAQKATISVGKAASTVEITSDEPDASTVGQNVHMEFTVSGSGGTPTGNVVITVSGGIETCSGTLSNGSGACDVVLTVPGTGANNRRTITATYAGDGGFNGDTDTENHRVNPLPSSNNPPTAAFNVPSCVVNVPCQFTDGSTDGDGSIASRSWTFGDGGLSNETNPSHMYAAATTFQVTLTVTDNEGALSTPAAHTVTVAAAPPASTTTTITGDGDDPSNPGVAISVTFTVTSGSGTPTGIVQVTDPNGGGCNADATVGNCSYTPAGTGLRTITATYQGNSSFGTSSDTEDHTVNQPPAAVDDAYSTPGGAALTVPARGVLENDTDEDKGSLTAAQKSSPTQGTLTLGSDGSFTYTPGEGASGTDSFTYTVTDTGGLTDEGTVTITFTD